ncbi:hypothetical protein, partial [Hydrogenophaga sp.]|uniref:hypothetical protein n=1 Tax=Hydrogenophaga sp. TaxID=1904254 RepID=UPI003D0DC5C7
MKMHLVLDTGGTLERNLEDADEVGLLDLLILVAENIKLLLLGSLLAGLITAGLAYIAPKSYVSQATLALPVPTLTPARASVPAMANNLTPLQAAALMTSPRVLDSAIRRLKLPEGQTAEQALEQVTHQVKVTPEQEGLLYLEVAAATPVQAQALANAVIDAWLESTTPGERARADLENAFSLAKSSLEATQRMIKRLSVDTGAATNKNLEQRHDGSALLAAAELQARYLSETTEILRLLRGYSRDVVKQPPTLPTQSESLPVGLIALLAAVAAAMALLLWLCIVQAWRSAARDPRVAPKLSRLRS